MLNTEYVTSDVVLDLIAPRTDVLVNPITNEPLTSDEIAYFLTADI